MILIMLKKEVACMHDVKYYYNDTFSQFSTTASYPPVKTLEYIIDNG